MHRGKRFNRFLFATLASVLSLSTLVIVLNLAQFGPNEFSRHQLDKSDQIDIQPLVLSRMATSKSMTYQGECLSTKMYNKTWGRTVAPLVDKIDAKPIVRNMGTSVSIPKTISIYDAENVSSFTAKAMQSLPDSVIKPSLGWGHNAQIVDGVYTCFRRCTIDDKPRSLKEGEGQLEKAHRKAWKEMDRVLTKGAADEIRETQYAVGSRRIIIEERLHIEKFLEVHWWVANGQPVFVCVRCNSGGQKRGTYFTTDFHELAMGSLMKCPNMTKPKTWDKMLSIVRRMGEHIPGIVCIDLYAGDDEVYFSEFTFTRAKCKSLMSPAVADALLFHVSHGLVAPHHVTPEYVQRTIEARSWAEVEFDPEEPRLESKKGLVIAARLPSSLDVCLRHNFSEVDSCTQRVASIASYPLHCVVKKQANISAIGLEKVPTISRIMEKLDWQWALGVAALAAYLTFSSTAKNPEREHWQIGNWWIYVALMTVYKWHNNHFDGLLAPTPILNTFVQSFEIFKLVHPVTSTAVALSHLASYWCPVAALFVRRRSLMLWMFLCYELGTAFVNEYAHFEEADDGVRCMRVSYIQHAKQYAINDVIRVYLLPPFFVYGYLLPKMVRYWAGF